MEAKTLQVAGNKQQPKLKNEKGAKRRGKGAPMGRDGTEASSDRASPYTFAIQRDCPACPDEIVGASRRIYHLPPDLSVAPWLCGERSFSLSLCSLCALWCIRMPLRLPVVPTLWEVRSNRKYNLLEVFENLGVNPLLIAN